MRKHLCGNCGFLSTDWAAFERHAVEAHQDLRAAADPTLKAEKWQDIVERTNQENLKDFQALSTASGMIIYDDTDPSVSQGFVKRDGEWVAVDSIDEEWSMVNGWVGSLHYRKARRDAGEAPG